MKVTGQLLAELVALVGGYLACEYITQSRAPKPKPAVIEPYRSPLQDAFGIPDRDPDA